MSLLSRPAPSGPRTPATSVVRSPLGLGALAAAQAVIGSLVCVASPALVVWVAASGTGSSWGEALRIAADAWLLAHHTAIAVAGGEVTLVPLGLSLVPAAWCWAAGRRMAAALDLAGAGSAGNAARGLTSFVGAYGALAVVVSLLAASPQARPLSGQSLLGSVLLALAMAGGGLLRAARTPSRPSAWAVLADGLRVPRRARRVLGAAAVALAAWTAAGALVVVGALLAGWDGVLAAHRALQPGVVGGAALVAGQLAYVPTAGLWGSAWLTGPGFAVGTGTSVNPWYADVGALPAVPLLAALPSGVLPGVVTAALTVPVVCGMLAGTWLHRAGREFRPWWRRGLVDGLSCGAVAGAGGGVLAWLASGQAGPGRLSVVGPDPLAVALVLAGEVALGATAVLAVLARRRTGERPGQAPSGRSSLSRLGIRLRSSIHRS